MKLAPRERKSTEFLEYSMPMWIMLPEYRPKKKSSKAKKAKAAAAAAKKAAAPAAKKGSKGKKKKATLAAAAGATPALETLTKEESKLVTRLSRRGSEMYKWQYWGDSGKWEDYKPHASNEVEKAYASWIVNPHVDVRSVTSGDWDYHVNFNTMQQMNIKHPNHKTRKIQRVPR